MKLAEIAPKEIQRLIEARDTGAAAADHRLIEDVRAHFGKRGHKFTLPQSEFPELIVTVPSSWPHVHLAPLYDVHIGHKKHDAAKFKRHLTWLAETPYVLTFNGGDMIENASKLSVGAGVYEQDYDPENQLVQAARQLAKVQHKMLFALPGNHEDRTLIMGVDVAKWLAWLLDLPYFPDFCFCTIKFAGNNFRIAAHHGSGGASTPGGQLMAARKMLPWVKADVYWTGHTHASKVDVIFQTDYDQKTGLMIDRSGLVLVSPSYIKYHSTYAAKKQYPPGITGLHAITLHRDGRMDVMIHANGRRL